MVIRIFGSLLTAAALTASLVGSAAAAAPAPAPAADKNSSKTAPQQPAYDWGRAKVVGGGFVPGIVYNPSEKDLIYARTDIGGAYRFDPATQSWIQLLDFVGFEEWSMLGVESIATDPVETNRVYAAVGTYTNDWTDTPGMILRSTDKGNSWQRTVLPFKLGGNMPGRSMGERLVIDPNDNRILYLGARSGNGLWRSTDYGETWSKVDSFTASGNVKDYFDDIVGVAWITFDQATGSKGKKSQTIYVGVADNEQSIYRSTDGGETWEAVAGQPKQGFVPHHGVLDGKGHLYVTYNEFVGPYDGGKGAVWKLDTTTGVWTDISPTGNTDNPYGGLAVDARQPNTLMVATMNKWWPDDVIYRSTNGGATWEPFWTLDFSENPNRENRFTIEYADSPWLDWGEKKELPEIAPKLGWMIGDLEIDPFNSDNMMYGTGATLFGASNLTDFDKDKKVDITVMADGIEETAVLGLISPPSGAPLLSAMGDIGGFRHESLDQAPEMITSPYIGTSTDIDFAELKPDIVVRVGHAEGTAARMGVSTDNGKTWTPAANAWTAADEDKTSGGFAAVSADGSAIVWSPSSADEQTARPVSYSTDLGKTWTASKGLPEKARVSADRVNPKLFYGFAAGAFYVSKDGGATFTASKATGLPQVITSNFKAMPGKEGDIWIAGAKDNKKVESAYGLWHSADAGKTFAKVVGVEEAATIGFGKAAPGKTNMTLYSYAKIGGTYGIFRSKDLGKNWVRINDDQHQFGSANTAITGDPRVYGRVYMATNGLGIVVGELKDGISYEFTDLSGVYAEAQQAIAFLYGKGVITGKNDTEFQPGAQVTRAEFVKLLVGTLGLVPEGTSSFADVTASAWYAPYIAAAEKAGITALLAQASGGEGSLFEPNEPITRQDMAVMLASGWKATGQTLPELPAGSVPVFTDSQTIAAYAKDTVALVGQAGLMKGKPDGSFGAIDPTNRADATVVIYRLHTLFSQAQAAKTE
ncbi:S-layer homology domain-containing protein [Paenibacillus sp. BIHB 4019]|uniref:S-layer homology domain-containing protein n=1 Tax=Paenibacillus sp. BIHB 4019 TaxID=1870819 RepID=UPI00329830B5